MKLSVELEEDFFLFLFITYWFNSFYKVCLSLKSRCFIIIIIFTFTLDK